MAANSESDLGHSHGGDLADGGDPGHGGHLGHGHGGDHGLTGSWHTWLGVPALRAILVAVAALAVLTAAGIIALWPDGSGREAAIDDAAQIGLVIERYSSTVETVLDGPCSYSNPEDPQQCRSFSVILEEGPDAGAVVVLPEYNLSAFAPAPPLEAGDRIIVGFEPSTLFYFYVDQDRGGTLLWLAACFAVVVVALGRARGLAALAAMAVTVVILVGFVAPSVLDGNDPLLVAVVGGSAIAFISLYLTHGLTPTTTVALAGTLASLLATLAISSLFFAAADFTGLATEEGLTLPLVADIDLSSLLLGGAVIGALGALDDVTVTQVATVAELHHRNRFLTVADLITSGIRVGREHIASTVNTLLLAYAGASMPLLLVFAATDQPLWDVANSEVVAVEIVRTLCGSIGLVAAVPLTTVLAAVLVGTSGVGDAGGGAPGIDGSDGSAPQPRPRRQPPRRPPSWDDFGPREAD